MNYFFRPEELPNFYPSSLATNDTFHLRRQPAATAFTGEGAAMGDRIQLDREELEMLRRLKLSLTATLADLRKDLLFISTVAMMEDSATKLINQEQGIKGNTPASMIRYKAGSALNKIDQILDVSYELQSPISEEDHYGGL